MRHVLLWSLFCSVFIWNSATQADTVSAAVAANFLGTAEQLGKQFEVLSGHKVTFSSSSTGKLYAQIKHAAPFDILLSADVKTPELLEKEGLCVKNTRFSYARGKLALWSSQADFIDNQAKILQQDSKFQHLAVANPSTAPYGLAAQQTLQNLQLWDKLQPKLVRGENVAQTLGFISAGSAELGFVALSQLMDNGKMTDKGSYWIVPRELYEPMLQQAVLLKVGEQNKAAKAFLTFLRTPEAQTIITTDGYSLP